MAVKHYYSVEAFSERDVAFPKYFVAVGRGVNVFTLATEDIQQALSEFAQEKVRVDKVHGFFRLECMGENRLAAILFTSPGA